MSSNKLEQRHERRHVRQKHHNALGQTDVQGVDEDIAFTRWYEKAYPKLLATMLLVIGDLDEAKEVADEACYRALLHWPRIGATERLEGWTYRVAYNVFRRRARRRALERRLLGRQPQRPNVPAPAGELWLLVNELPRRQREVVMLHYVADLTEREIAEALGVARGTVSRTLGTARTKLADALAEPPAISNESRVGPEQKLSQLPPTLPRIGGRRNGVPLQSHDLTQQASKIQSHGGTQCHD